MPSNTCSNCVETNVIKLISITMGLFLGWVFLAKIVYVESYNKSFPDAERIYRVDERVTLPDREIRAGYISAPVAPALKDEFPEIETATVICRHFPLLTHGEHPFEINIACTDTAFFDLFSIEVLSGDPERLFRIRTTCSFPEKRRDGSSAKPTRSDKCWRKRPEPITG